MPGHTQQVANYSEDIKQLVKIRLSAMPPNISLSIGGYGDFTPQELIEEINKNTEIGNDIIEMQLDYIRYLPNILNIKKG